MFLSLSLVAQTALSFYIPLFGQNGMRVGVSAIFTVMPAILFGPLYGGIVFGLSDILGHLLRPMGAYLPLMTVIVVLGGVLRGVLWLWLRDKNNNIMRFIVAFAAVILLIIGLSNVNALRKDHIDRDFYTRTATEEINTDDMQVISRLVINRTRNAANPSDSLATFIIFVTAGVLGSAAFGLFLLLADWLLVKFFVKGRVQSRIMPLFIAMVTGGIMVTTLNTILLRETVFESWKLLPFTVVWIPRLIETILSHTIYVYFVAFLLGLMENQRNMKDWIPLKGNKDADSGKH
jgi:hypothetical protein